MGLLSLNFWLLSRLLPFLPHCYCPCSRRPKEKRIESRDLPKSAHARNRRPTAAGFFGHGEPLAEPAVCVSSQPIFDRANGQWNETGKRWFHLATHPQSVNHPTVTLRTSKIEIRSTVTVNGSSRRDQQRQAIHSSVALMPRACAAWGWPATSLPALRAELPVGLRGALRGVLGGDAAVDPAVGARHRARRTLGHALSRRH